MKSGTVAACGPGLDAALTHYRISTTTRPLEDDEEDGAVERIKVLQSSQLDLMFANDVARAELAVTENNRPRSVLTGPDIGSSCARRRGSLGYGGLLGGGTRARLHGAAAPRDPEYLD